MSLGQNQEPTGDKFDRPLPRWWWITNAALLVLMFVVGVLRARAGEKIEAALFPMFTVITLIAIPLLSREWRHFRQRS